MSAPSAARSEYRHTRKGRLEHRRKVRQWTKIAVAAVIAIIIAIIIALVASSEDDPPAAVTTADINLELGDYYIAGDLEVPAGEVTLEAVNVGAIPHNVGIRRGPISGQLLTGKRTTLDLGTLVPGTYELYCDIPGHVEAGMVAPLVVTEPVAATGTVAVSSG